MTTTHDLVIVGAGPAGLAAAINGASEGLHVALIDAATSLGGQARESACVENYPLPFGSHNGVSGHELMMGFTAQAEKFRAAITAPAKATRLVVDGDDRIVLTDGFDEFRARAVILAMGLDYRRLDAEGISRYMGRGVYYGAPPVLEDDVTVAVVGGANSAGQAVVRLAANPRTKVILIARGEIGKQMSSYLVERVRAAPNVTVLEDASVTAVGGTMRLETIFVGTAGGQKEYRADRMFIFIGAMPHTAWLPDSVKMDAKHYIVTDGDVGASFVGRSVMPCETSLPGVFAAGDIRHGQGVKRITGAVFDGVCAIQSCHRYLGGLA